MGRSRNDTTSNVQNSRHRQSCKSALHAGWVRSCLQDKSGRTNQACDWPTRTCNASGSRADCAAAGYRVKAGLPCERWLECNERVFRVRLALHLPLCLFSLFSCFSFLFSTLFIYLYFYFILIFFFHFNLLFCFFFSLFASLRFFVNFLVVNNVSKY